MGSKCLVGLEMLVGKADPYSLLKKTGVLVWCGEKLTASFSGWLGY
jgi:hypothetical protein